MNLTNILIDDNEFLPFINTINENLAMISDIGQKKKTNQDFGRVGVRKDGAVIMIVADGVSCSQSPSIASEKATNALYEVLDNSNSFDQEIINYAISMADIAVKAIPFNQHHRLDGPETTIVCALIKDGKAHIGWVGDSRAYKINENECVLLTEDDSWCNKMVKENRLTLEQAERSDKSHVITQCLGLRDFVINIHTISVDMDTNDALLLCSDGLWNMIDLKENNWKNSAEIEAWLMISEANRAGGRDNITIAINRPSLK